MVDPVEAVSKEKRKDRVSLIQALIDAVYQPSPSFKHDSRIEEIAKQSLAICSPFTKSLRELVSQVLHSDAKLGEKIMKRWQESIKQKNELDKENHQRLLLKERQVSDSNNPVSSDAK